MTTALDTIRYNSGMAGEEVANMVDTLEDEIESLRQQLAESQERVKELEDVRQNDVDEYNILNAQLAAALAACAELTDAYITVNPHHSGALRKSALARRGVKSSL